MLAINILGSLIPNNTFLSISLRELKSLNIVSSKVPEDRLKSNIISQIADSKKHIRINFLLRVIA